jgi:starvation-inducible DNA-binding protein
MIPLTGISEKQLKLNLKVLSILLANEMTLYIKTRKSHWNVSGDSFMELNKLYEGQYKQLEEMVDQIAERINSLGQKTIGTMHEYLKLASIKESPDKYLSSKDILKELLADHETMTLELRKIIKMCTTETNDAASADFLTGLLEQHESTAWIIRTYLN